MEFLDGVPEVLFAVFEGVVAVTFAGLAVVPETFVVEAVELTGLVVEAVEFAIFVVVAELERTPVVVVFTLLFTVVEPPAFLLKI